MSTTIAYSEQLVIETCPTCHVSHGVPSSLHQRAKDRLGPNGTCIYCPNGHRWHFTGKTEAEKLREQLEAKDRTLAYERSRRDQLAAEIEHQAAVARGYKGALAKARKRAANGVCPAPGCRRSFTDLADHVATCHPDLTTTEATS